MITDDQDQPLSLETDLGQPVEQRDQPRPVRPISSTTDREDRGSCVRTLQTAKPEQEIRDVPENDQDDRLGEREPERHQDRSVDEVLDLDARPGPHSE
jgi:hypothetical protein